MSGDSEARDRAARTKRNQEMASDLITRVEYSRAHRARAARHEEHKDEDT